MWTHFDSCYIFHEIHTLSSLLVQRTKYQIWKNERSEKKFFFSALPSPTHAHVSYVNTMDLVVHCLWFQSTKKKQTMQYARVSCVHAFSTNFFSFVSSLLSILSRFENVVRKLWPWNVDSTTSSQSFSRERAVRFYSLVSCAISSRHIVNIRKIMHSQWQSNRPKPRMKSILNLNMFYADGERKCYGNWNNGTTFGSEMLRDAFHIHWTIERCRLNRWMAIWTIFGFWISTKGTVFGLSFPQYPLSSNFIQKKEFPNKNEWMKRRESGGNHLQVLSFNSQWENRLSSPRKQTFSDRSWQH